MRHAELRYQSGHAVGVPNHKKTSALTENTPQIQLHKGWGGAFKSRGRAGSDLQSISSLQKPKHSLMLRAVFLLESKSVENWILRNQKVRFCESIDDIGGLMI